MNHLSKRTSSLFPHLSELHHALDRMFEPSLLGTELTSLHWAPTIDVKDDGKQYVIRADIPGVDPKNIELTLEKDCLTIKGTKETEKKQEEGNYIYFERSQGSFYRSVTLPQAVDSSKIDAKSKNGVLEIKIPKVKGSSMHKIQVKEA